ncbi:MAG: TetR/AcrR family transcriptional regulator [Actinobacteria bacterium]|nr:TetR/AcrR family transcriptional regulator [Actinomycetota bacterium]MCG2802255.1 TetR/AcrR family transcriptional regulator [Cellulomonas sp.]
MARTAPTAKDDILAAAARCFARGGYRATSLREIADEYGGSKAALLYHFASKEEILSRLSHDHWAAVHELAADVRHRDGADARDAARAGMVDLAVAHRDVVAIVHAEMRAIIRLDSFRDDGEAMDEIADALAGRSARLDDQRMARTLLGAVATACREFEGADDATLRSALEALLTITLPGAAGHGAPPDEGAHRPPAVGAPAAEGATGQFGAATHRPGLPS